jgi:hypothetical protein
MNVMPGVVTAASDVLHSRGKRFLDQALRKWRFSAPAFSRHQRAGFVSFALRLAA